MFRYLTNTELTSENHVEQKIDERLDLLMKSDDPKLIIDWIDWLIISWIFEQTKARLKIPSMMCSGRS